jgi:phycocyanobilin lyase beta subunit
LRLEGLDPVRRSQTQQRCLKALLAACGDGEWVVRYAVVVGLESLGRSSQAPRPGPASLVECLERLAHGDQETIPVVSLRSRLALDRLSSQ